MSALILLAPLCATFVPSPHMGWTSMHECGVARPCSSSIQARIDIRGLDSSAVPDRSVSLLTASSILSPENQAQLAILASALQKDINTRFTRRNPAEHSLVIAVDEDTGEIVGCCGIDVQRLTTTALGADRIGRSSARLSERPLLSSLAVSPDYRRRGLAKRLCSEVEKAARSWGFNEVLLKVESDNRRARRLYSKLGYRVVSIDKEAERPIAGPGGLKFVTTTQVAMRKDLRYPPVDVVLTWASLAFAGAFLSTSVGAEQLGAVADLLMRGQVSAGWDLLLTSL